MPAGGMNAVLQPSVTTAKKDSPASFPLMRSVQTLVIASAIGLAVTLAYVNALRVPFLSDDQSSIVENPTIHSFSWKAFSPPGALGLTVEGRTILNVSLAVNYAWSGTDVGSYHAT